jgi:hypothetical protein
MTQSNKLFARKTTVDNVTVFHAMCLANWAYTRDNHSKDNEIASRVGMTVPAFHFIAGSNAPQFMVSIDDFGTQVAIAGTTDLAQWMDYITRAGVTNATGLAGKTFGPFDDWSNRITEVLRNSISDRKPILFTGHSLGGAMAILVAEKMFKLGFLYAVVYTFASPRVGDDEFTYRYLSLVHNIRNQGDVVPSLPPAALSYVRILPTFQQVLPYMSRPGFDYMIPHGPRPWLNPSTLVAAASPGLWAASIPVRVGQEHGEFAYLRSAWRLGTQGERFKANDWYGVCNGLWGVGLNPSQ